MRNLSPLFSSNENGLIGNLELTKEQKKIIQNAKILIREHLRTGIQHHTKSSFAKEISPRFLSQGSYVYKTRNKPCKNPPQQIDHDIGCYLPLSYIESTKNPSIEADKFFNIVDSLLKEIVEKEKWQSVDISKATCSRVIVNSQIHIDVPLYSIPDNEFHTIKEEVAKNTVFSGTEALEQNWDEIKDNVLLAHRTDDWIVSDPRKLNDYFNNIFEIKAHIPHNKLQTLDNFIF